MGCGSDPECSSDVGGVDRCVRCTFDAVVGSLWSSNLSHRTGGSKTEPPHWVGKPKDGVLPFRGRSVSRGTAGLDERADRFAARHRTPPPVIVAALFGARSMPATSSVLSSCQNSPLTAFCARAARVDAFPCRVGLSPLREKRTYCRRAGDLLPRECQRTPRRAPPASPLREGGGSKREQAGS